MSSPVSAYKALADPTRRAILELLRHEDLSAGRIADAFELSKPAISHHLKLLTQAGLVQAQRQGKSIIYSLDTTALHDMMRWAMDLISEAKGASDDD